MHNKEKLWINKTIQSFLIYNSKNASHLDWYASNKNLFPALFSTQSDITVYHPRSSCRKLSNKTGGYSYGLLTIIANNAMFEYRDMYLRPNVYAEYEAQVKILLADLITAVENGTMTYKDAKKEAYTRIYKSVDPSYDPKDRFLVDFCYWDVISVDGAMFNRARKVLLDAEAKYQASQCQICMN